jgi:hypothetical protein
MTINEMTSEDREQFKECVKYCLENGTVNISFLKLDGTSREMKCTLDTSLIPQIEKSVDTPKKERIINENVLPVYDLDNSAWRSFSWDRLTSLTINFNIQ